MLTQSSDFKAQFKQFSDAIDNHEDRLTTLELGIGRGDDQTRFEEKLASTQQAIVYTQHQKSLVEVIIGGLPIETMLSDIEITQRILQKIDAHIYFSDIMFARRRPVKSINKSITNSSEWSSTFSIIVRFKNENVRNEVMHLKKTLW